MRNKKTPDLKTLFVSFPKIDPPFTISEDVLINFSADNKALSPEIISHYFGHNSFDEFTEIIPCCQFEVADNFHTIIYWKGALMTYEFILMTLDKEGNLISEKVIAGTLSNGQSIIKSVAHIGEDFKIYVTTGENAVDAVELQPNKNAAFRFEILSDGDIQSSIEENNLWQEENQKIKN